MNFEDDDDDNPVIERRASIDYVIRSQLQTVVTQIGQADMKASVVVSATTITLSIIAAVWSGGEEIRPTLLVGAIGSTIALMSALAVLMPRLKTLSDDRRPIFFPVWVAEQQVDDFIEIALGVLGDDDALYRTMLGDYYGQARTLVLGKYRWLRVAYVVIFVTAPAAVITAAITLA